MALRSCIALAALHAGLAAAQWQPTTIAAAARHAPGSALVFAAGADPATGLGDVQAHADPELNTPLWSASALLAERRHTVALPRQILSLADGPSWTTLAAALRVVPLGAVRNANLWYVGPATGPVARQATVYAGALDGMLHAFDAEHGTELFAYVPRGLVPPLAARAPAGIDGPLFGGEAPIGPGGANSVLLVAALGAGGKGFVVLDASDPSAPAALQAADFALLDRSGDDDADIGHLQAPAALDDAGRPHHVVRMQDGRSALVVGNGFHSAAGRPVLLVQYLDQARELVRLSPCEGQAACPHAGGNGLAMPRLVDTDGDGRVDLAYAGDLQGQLWKFDLGGAPQRWQVAFGGQPLFTACDDTGRRQAITTTPYVQAHPLGGSMLVVGTGRHLRPDDAADQTPQSIYGVRDGTPVSAERPPASPPGCARPAGLVRQAYSAAVAADGVDYHTVSGTAVDYSRADSPQRGWWIDLPHAGQRVLLNPRAFEGRKLLVHSVVPNGGAGLPATAGRGYLSVLNLLTGLAPERPAFAPADAALAAQPIGMVSAPAGPALQQRVPHGVQLQHADGQQVLLRGASTTGTRIGWRERP